VTGPEATIESWKLCNECSMRAYKDDLCVTHWARRYSCVPVWNEEKGEWFCKHCHLLTTPETLRGKCPTKLL
jgi:hypothetical protein